VSALASARRAASYISVQLGVDEVKLLGPPREQPRRTCLGKDGGRSSCSPHCRTMRTEAVCVRWPKTGSQNREASRIASLFVSLTGGSDVAQLSRLDRRQRVVPTRGLDDAEVSAAPSRLDIGKVRLREFQLVSFRYGGECHLDWPQPADRGSVESGLQAHALIESAVGTSVIPRRRDLA
jgi:hypothetical protein